MTYAHFGSRRQAPGAKNAREVDQNRTIVPFNNVILATPVPMQHDLGDRRVAYSDAKRVRAALDTHYDAIWRYVRRLGVASADADDAAQKVFLVFAQRIASIDTAAERAFLFATAMRVASDARRKRVRSREELTHDGEVFDVEDHGPSVEDQIDARRMRRMLDDVLDTLPDEYRAVLVLVDIDGETMADASQLLGIPPGTVASRLRRSRELFEAGANELKMRLNKESQR